jgi:drug/metabolite transporter (DMT)-like permease
LNRRNQIDAIGALLLIICSALMGVNQVLVKIINAGLHPVFQAGLRSAFAFFPVLLYALITKKTLSLQDGSFWPGILVGIFFGIEFLLLFQALDYTTVSRASIFFYTMPFWTALAAHFLIPGEKLTILRTAGLLLAICGVVLALSVNQSPASPDAFIGDIFCLIGAVFWSGIIIVARTTNLSKSTPEMQLLYQLAVSAVILLAVAPYFGELVRDLNSIHVALFTFQVLAVVCFGFLTWFWVLSVYPASSMASYSFLAPVFGVFFGWLILGEQMTETIMIALVLVSAGVYLVNRKPASARSV